MAMEYDYVVVIIYRHKGVTVLFSRDLKKDDPPIR